MPLSRQDQFSLGLQRFLGWLFFPILGGLTVLLMRFVMGYRVPDMRQVRRQFKQLLGKEKTPLLICANHLTMIDSAIIAWSIASNWSYWWRFRLFAWNMPERRNFAHILPLKIICYLLKCVPIIRGGPPHETKRTMDKINYLLAQSQAICIFPEGTRSKSGRINLDEPTYGVGRLVLTHPGTRVLCVYQRGQQQEKSSFFPKKGDVFFTDIDMIQPVSDSKGLRAVRDVSTQIMQKLYDMEQSYFATHRQ